MPVSLKALLLGLGVGLLGALISFTILGFYLEETFGLAWLFELRGPREPPSQVVIVAINQNAARVLGLGAEPRDWPRSTHARLIDKLSAAGARVIAIDLNFKKPSSREHDERLADAMTRANNVVLVASLQRQSQLGPSQAAGAAGDPNSERIVPPIAPLARAAVALAPFPLPAVPERVNESWTFKFGAEELPTLPIVAFQVYALPVYEEWRRLLLRVDPELAARLPAEARDVVANKQVLQVIQTLRGMLANDPVKLSLLLSALDSQDSNSQAEPRRQLLRALAATYAADELEYLNYYGPPQTIRTIAYDEALAMTESAARAQFADKAVFIGFSAASQEQQDPTRDHYYTVYPGAGGLHINGVEIAATAFANSLENSRVRTLELPAELALVFAWGVSIGTICYVFRFWLAAVVAPLVSLAYLAVAHYRFSASALWLPLVVPLCVQSPLAFFGAALLHYRDARREREIIRIVFGYFLPAKVVDQLARSMGPIASNNRLVYGTCLATDAEQFTALAETVDPEQLNTLMNDYYAALFKPVEQHGGVVSDVVGDAMLAIWAASAPDAQLRHSACSAALAIMRAGDEFNRGREAHKLPTRIGLHAGQMSLGTLGAGRHYEYRAVGDIVNTANRIQALNKTLGTRLLVSESALEPETEFLARRMGRFVLSGKTVAIAIFELICLKKDATSDQLWLCNTFGEAVAAFQSSLWEDAMHRFAQVSDKFPDDGAARFYSRRCVQHLASPSVSDWDGVIRIDAK